MNWIKKYADAIESGKVVVGERVRRVYLQLAEETELPGEKWHFDEALSERPIQFIEKFCRQSKGEWIGKPLKLQLFQKAFLGALFGFVDENGLRRFKETLFLCGRKNGKSSLLSGLSLFMLTADHEGGAEVYACATKRDQSRIIFRECQNMVSQSPALSARVKKRISDLYYSRTYSKMEALASDSNSLDGLNSHCVVIDELHAIKDRNLYEVMRQSMSARRQPLLVMITTAGTVRECIFDDMYEYACSVADGAVQDERFLPVLYELDSRDEWAQPEKWEKANPGLGTIKKVDDLAEKVERAKKNPKEVAGVLCKDFNWRENQGSAWISFDDLNNTEPCGDMSDSYAVGGVDLSSTTDLTCATLCVKKADGILRVKQQYFIPENILERKVQEDKIPYDLWAKQGWVTLTEGERVDYSAVTDWFKRMRDEESIYPLWIGYDTWGSQYWASEMRDAGFVLEPVIQGAKTMSQPMKELAAEFMGGKVVYDNNPLLKWCLSNVQIKTDENANIRPVKGRNDKLRIDGAVSLIDAYVVLLRHWDDYVNMI